MRIQISEIKINPGRRPALPEDVDALAKSIAELGLLNPVTVDREYTLIAGLHRLEAAKQLGWEEIECNVSSLEGLRAELAEIDENLIRSELHYTDEGLQLVRRKEIYETLHPETRQGRRNGQTSKTDTVSVLGERSFAEDAAEKLGTTARTVRRKIQVAQKLTPEAARLAKENNIRFRDAVKLSRLEPSKQCEAVLQLAEGEISSPDEYGSPLQNPEGPEPPPACEASAAVQPDQAGVPGEKRFASFRESVADLKDHNKDCSYTPEALLAELTVFVRKFHLEIDWYGSPACAASFPGLSPEQFSYLQQQLDSICSDVKELLQKIKEERDL